jgi:hypothetical protein
MTNKPYAYEVGEQIAIAIRYAMQDDMTHFRAVMARLREEEKWSDEQIGTAFMEIGAILFYEDIENDLEDIVNGEIK